MFFTPNSRFKFPPNMIFNLDERGITNMQAPKHIVTEMGKKQVGSVWGKRGACHPDLCCCHPSHVHLPLCALPQALYQRFSCGFSRLLINQQEFVQFLQHMICHTRCSPSNPLLLILDNHDSHRRLSVWQRRMALCF